MDDPHQGLEMKGQPASQQSNKNMTDRPTQHHGPEALHDGLTGNPAKCSFSILGNILSPYHKGQKKELSTERGPQYVRVTARQPQYVRATAGCHTTIVAHSTFGSPQDSPQYVRVTAGQYPVLQPLSHRP
ncbi:hypothetical protein DY000_02007930 [Brassica cretica]|uniref:Uncharacterized protein n=1 Tax=Brassica cretica TaxID=69181 RepID=A0ABQ7BVY8_BRACR|nr:hypothetical protein DY000_02007930 [Brassica cretica]